MLSRSRREALRRLVQPLRNLSSFSSETEEVVVPHDLPHHQLEKALGDNYAAVQIRREIIASELDKASFPSSSSSSRSRFASPKSDFHHQVGDAAVEDNERRGEEQSSRGAAVFKIPALQGDFDVASFYDQVHGTNCENVIGFIPVPVGVVGPLVVNGEHYTVPLATTEGALLASTNRGARAIRESGGAVCRVVENGMTRSPVLALESVVEASEFKAWVEDPARFQALADKFAETTQFGRLTGVKATVVGRYVYLRFKAETGDAMGMNMIGKGVNHIVATLVSEYPGLTLISLSSNMCTDKKPSAINWTQGRGKSVVAETVLSKDTVEKVLKTTIPDLVQLNIAKNLVGSALAGSIGGNNAHASNLVTAFFIANGQDPAQNVESSNCMILMEPCNDGNSLRVSASMPSLEVGTVGGGTTLATQRACLEMLGVAGANRQSPGKNAEKLAQIVCATVLAGELSLNAALASNHLISAHMQLNRKPGAPTNSTSPRPPVSKKFEQSQVQPGLKKQRTSHDHELIGSGRRFAAYAVKARQPVVNASSRLASRPSFSTPQPDRESDFDAPMLPVP